MTKPSKPPRRTQPASAFASTDLAFAKFLRDWTRRMRADASAEARKRAREATGYYYVKPYKVKAGWRRLPVRRKP